MSGDVALAEGGGAVGQGEDVPEVAGDEAFGRDQVPVGVDAGAGFGVGDQEVGDSDGGLAVLGERLAVAAGGPQELPRPGPQALHVGGDLP